jgi:phage-related protein
MLPLDDRISQNSSNAVSSTVIKAQFGNGGTQIATFGINHQRKTWNIVWEPLDVTDRQIIQDFYAENGVFKTWTWTARGDTQERYWRFSGDLKEDNTADWYFLSAPIVEEFA